MKDKSWIWSTITAGGHFWVDFYGNMLPAILPFIGILWGLSNSQLALVVSVQSMTANFLQPVLGYYMDKNPQKWSLGLAILLMAVPMCFIYKANNYYLFIITVTIAGLGSALYHPLGASQAVRGGNIKDKALKMSFFSSLGSLGFAISPAITAFIISKWGLQSLMYTIVPAIIWVLLIRIYKIRENSVVLHQERINTVSEGISDYSPLILLSSVVALRSWLITAATVFIPLWLVAQGVGEREAGLNLTYFLISGTMGGFTYGYIYPRIGARKVLILSFILTLVFLPLYLFIAVQYKLIFLILLGFNLMGTFPVTVVIGQELLPDRTGLASGLTMGLAFGIGGLGTAVTGFVADITGTAFALVLNSLLLIPAIFIVKLLEKRREMSDVRVVRGGI